MNHKLSTSSFSSFSSKEQYTTCLPLQAKGKKLTKIIKQNIQKQDRIMRLEKQLNQQFSAYEDDNIQLQRYKLIAQSSQTTITKLKLQISQLLVSNQKLLISNQSMREQLEKLKLQKMKQQTQLYTMREIAQEKQQKRDKMQQYLKQTLKIKESMHYLRQQCDKYQIQCVELQKIISKYQKQSIQWGWKQNFIQLFIDMLRKISTGIDQRWTDKKKIQIGWKIVKNLMHKAFISGIKPPRVQKSGI